MGGNPIGASILKSILPVKCRYRGFPPLDNFQIISEHKRDTLRYNPEYLNIPRTDGIVVIKIPMNERRSVKVKKAFYEALAERHCPIC